MSIKNRIVVQGVVDGFKISERQARELVRGVNKNITAYGSRSITQDSLRTILEEIGKKAEDQGIKFSKGGQGLEKFLRGVEKNIIKDAKNPTPKPTVPNSIEKANERLGKRLDEALDVQVYGPYEEPKQNPQAVKNNGTINRPKGVVLPNSPYSTFTPGKSGPSAPNIG
jgi:hypothetical protein